MILCSLKKKQHEGQSTLFEKKQIKIKEDEKFSFVSTDSF